MVMVRHKAVMQIFIKKCAFRSRFLLGFSYTACLLSLSKTLSFCTLLLLVKLHCDLLRVEAEEDGLTHYKHKLYHYFVSFIKYTLKLTYDHDEMKVNKKI